jgi:hypothetical protein
MRLLDPVLNDLTPRHLEIFGRYQVVRSAHLRKLPADERGGASAGGHAGGRVGQPVRSN